MYGYVRVEKNALSCDGSRDYYACYCGLCKTAGKRHGQFSRFLVSYDIAFLDIFMRGLCGIRAEIKEEKCIANIRKKRGIAAKTPLTELVSDISVLLGYYKLTDDIIDGGSLKRRLMRTGLRRAYKHAKREHRPLEAQIKASYDRLRISENVNDSNLDSVSHHFAEMLSSVAVYMLSVQNVKICTDDEMSLTRELFYNLGKWVYIMDAADDLEKDTESGNYNPLKVPENKSAAAFVLGCSAARIAECYEKLGVSANREILENIIYRGLLARTEKILKKGETQND